jgi:lysophospholipase L1-like esterase
MRNVTYAALSAGLLLACGGSAQAMGELVLGDSLGVGVKIASGHTGPARLSQFIRNDQILAQLSQVPDGATAFLVLGTNDSAGSVKGLEKNIDNIVRAVESRKIKLVWVGPPCVRKSWDKNSRDLDAMLSARLASTSIKYISIRSDAELCSGQYTGGDGVHMNFTGYSLMWNKARAAAGLPASEDKPVRVASRKPSADKPSSDVTGSTRRTTTLVSADATPRRKKPAARSEPEPFNFFSLLFRRSN